MASGLHKNGVSRVKIETKGPDDNNGGGRVTFRAIDGSVWHMPIRSEQRRGTWWRMDRNLVSSSGVAIARSGAPNMVVARQNYDGGRRQTTINSGEQRENSREQWLTMLDN